MEYKKMIVEGRAWLITDQNWELISDIDTDMIYHNAHLAVVDIREMAQYAFGNLNGWVRFPELCKPHDIIVAGHNFGAGSSRQQAVDCFAALNVSLIIAQSFGAIYKRNAINSGFPILQYPQIDKLIRNNSLEHLDEISVNLENGAVFNQSKNKSLGITEPLAKVQKDIFLAGNLFQFGKKM